MKTLLLLLILGTAGALSAAEECRIVTSDGKTIKTSAITARANGDLEYVSPESNLKIRISKGRFRYAWIPKPSGITEADAKYTAGDYKNAAELYLKAYLNYRLLGWDLYCLRMEAKALDKIGLRNEALKKLEELRNTRIQNPEQETDYLRAMNDLAELYLLQDNSKEAEKLLDKVIRSKNDELSSGAFLKKGDLLRKNGDEKEALIHYFQVVMLFPKSSRRPEAIFKTWQLLTAMKDTRAQKFADQLRKEYPNDPYAGKLK